MVTKEHAENDAFRADETDVESGRARSTIQFPYNDLDDAISVARLIHANAGVQCTIDQIAAYAKQSITSGSFRVRLSTASTFGVTENERGSVRLTEIGRQIVDPAQEANARVEAFLHVPLYARVFENYKGYTLPPAAALEKFMREAGVAPNQTGRARQAFMRSARQAGFFVHGEDRLVRPAGPGTKPTDQQKPDPVIEKQDTKFGGGGGGDEPPAIDPIIAGLLARLPKSGDVWPIAERKLWLQLLEGSFQLIYKDGSAQVPPPPGDAEYRKTQQQQEVK
ncbi:hypothetical protein [Rhodopseudomonas palustris]|uniref:Uncharacterized protein n=1 Tax=Rhodopseudomonas palustris (strain BisB18) TaxID=316056 RepID=Q218S0_RHOPB